MNTTFAQVHLRHYLHCDVHKLNLILPHVDNLCTKVETSGVHTFRSLLIAGTYFLEELRITVKESNITLRSIMVANSTEANSIRIYNCSEGIEVSESVKSSEAVKGWMPNEWTSYASTKRDRLEPIRPWLNPTRRRTPGTLR